MQTMTAALEGARDGAVTGDVEVPVVCAVWTVTAAGKSFRVKTCSARTALAHAHQRTGEPGKLVGFKLSTKAPTKPREIPNTRLGRLRKSLKPEALRRRATGETVTSIAKSLHLPRETVRDWVLTARVSR
jgi:hypothetical protein